MRDSDIAIQVPNARHPGLDPGSRFFLLHSMADERGGWVCIMTNRYRGTLYVGVTADLSTRVYQRKTGDGSDFCRREGLTRLIWAEHIPDIAEAIAHEKRVKRWHRKWKFELIERANPEWADLYWADLYDQLI